MSTNTFPYSYSLVNNALASHTEHSVLVYTSRDGVDFDTHPSLIYRYYSMNDLSTVLPELNTKFAIQVSNIYTRAAIDSA